MYYTGDHQDSSVIHNFTLTQLLITIYTGTVISCVLALFIPKCLRVWEDWM